MLTKIDMNVRRFEQRNQNTLQGVFSIGFPIAPGAELLVHRCLYHVHPSGKKWVAFPAQPYGANQFAKFIEIEGDDAKTAFREAAVAAVEAYRAKEEK